MPVTAPALSGFKITSFFENFWGIGEPPPNDQQVTQGLIGGQSVTKSEMESYRLRIGIQLRYFATPYLHLLRLAAPTQCCG